MKKMNKLEFVESHSEDREGYEKEKNDNLKIINNLKFKNQLLKERISMQLVTVDETQAELDNNLVRINELTFANTILDGHIEKSQNIILSALLTEDWD